MTVILAVEFQECYLKGFVNMTEVRNAAEVVCVIVALVVL